MKPRKPTDFKGLLELIESFSSKESVSNNYMLPSEMEALFNAGDLKECHSARNLFLLVRKAGGCYRVYYILNDLSEIAEIDSDMPLMSEILFRGNTGIPDAEIKYLESCGYKTNLRRDQYAAPIKDVPEIIPTFASNILTAEKAITLFNATFDRFSGDFIPHAEAERLLERNELICLSETDSSLQGALHLEIIGKNAWIDHLAVSHEHRRKGIASQLVKMYIKAAEERGAKRLMLWVQHQNEAAIALYKSFGFAYTNKSTISLIKY